jgi:hypothetical protein
MGIFGNKQKYSMEQFCEQFYNSMIFDTPGKESDRDINTIDGAYQLLENADKAFSRVDRDTFGHEMAAMHLELFSLAFMKQYSDFNHEIHHSVFTREYLRQKNRLDIWETMQEYNRLISQTATMKADGNQMTNNTAIERMTIAQVTSLRAELFKKWVRDNSINLENVTERENELAQCVTRVCNRLGADIMGRNQVGNRRLSASLLFRLGGDKLWPEGREPGGDFLLKLASQSYSMYDFALNALKKVDLVF